MHTVLHINVDTHPTPTNTQLLAHTNTQLLASPFKETHNRKNINHFYLQLGTSKIISA